MGEHWFSTLLTLVYFAILGVVALYGFHRYVLVYLYIKHRHVRHTPTAHYSDPELPAITVQLPMFNEDAVAERVIDATCRIDYPREKLQIQVLDDSTDADAAEIARKSCDAWREKGIDIQYLHRNNRDGFKAGALQEGLKSASGEYVAIFDADFIPPADILRNVVDHFSDPKIGMVQVRWDHLNRDASLLTKSQAIFLDGHFVIEHTARNRSGRFMHFNGTAGVWRRTTIAEAGGWQHDTLTEDLDLSYRAQLKGWQFVYLPQHVAPAELPPEMVSFKQQAHRWTKGSMQTAIKLLPRIMNSKLPWSIKSEAFFHLTCTVVYPLMVMMTLLMYPTFIINQQMKINATPMVEPLVKLSKVTPEQWHGPSLNNWVFGFSLFVLATCSASTFFIYAQKELFGRREGWKTLLHLPFIMALGVGVCINNTKAVIEAIISMIQRKPAEFVRTPKYGVTGKQRSRVLREAPKFNYSKLALPIVEVAFGLYMTCFIVISVRYNAALTSIPFLMIFAGGYFYVGFSTLAVLYQRHQEAVAAASAPVEVIEEPVAA
ncbi:MAG: glycosyltransferase [Tepidisphaeraceae bacterium]